MNTQEQGKLVGEAAMRAALKMAIDALEWLSYSERTAKQLEAIDACNQAISSQSDALATEQVREEPSRVRQNDVPAQGPVDLEEELNNCDGKKCICFAMYQGECACDADWTPEEVVKLRHQLNNTHPHQDGTSPSEARDKEFVTLTEDEIAKCFDEVMIVDEISSEFTPINFARAIEQELKRKNYFNGEKNHG